MIVPNHITHATAKRYERVAAKIGRPQELDFFPGAAFARTGQFVHKLIPLKNLEQRVKLIRFRKALHNAEQNK